MSTLQIENARTLEQKQETLVDILQSLGRVLVGYSGGVDSAVLAVAAHRALGEDAIAVTADSESYASGELEAATRMMRDVGMRHEVVRTRELENPDYASNPTNRCYFCKQELFTNMHRLADELRADAILYGQNTDDVGDFRPGAKAASDYGVRAPLREAGLSKQDVRDLAKQWGLPVWNRPAMACLSSRFPYGTPVTAAGLRQVDRAEAFLRSCGFEQLRVRHHTDIARLELPADDLASLLADAALRRRVQAELSVIGYRQVTADLRGFRSGSLNEVLGEPTAAREEDRFRDAAQQAVTEAGLWSGAIGMCQRIAVLTLADDDISGLADEPCRLALVEQLESLGAQYVAVDLEPSQGANRSE